MKVNRAHLPWIFLVPLFGVFFLTDGSKLRNSALELVSETRTRRFIEGVLDDLDTMLAQYVRAQSPVSWQASPNDAAWPCREPNRWPPPPTSPSPMIRALLAP